MNSPPTRKPRLLILVVDHHAESATEAVLEGIPSPLFEQYDTEVLVVDDAAEDRTSAIGRAYRRSHPEIGVTVLRNLYSRGYGGNQKVGFAYAIARRFDFVAVVRAGESPASAELPGLLEPLLAGQADAVFGSRTTGAGDAPEGTALHRRLGERALVALQRAMLRTKLAGIHSGYRAYSVSTLDRVPYRLNSNGSGFDTEIAIQLLSVQARIVERPIRTRDRGEGRGIGHAKDVLWAMVQGAAHRSGLIHERRFDVGGEGNAHYDLKLGYASSHTYALAAVPRGAKVLDIGSGPGGLARELRRKDCDVTVVDQHAPTVPSLDVKVITQDLDAPLAFDARRYEVLLLLDVIEHLRDPERFMDLLRGQLDHQPKKIVLTTPNVAFVIQRLMLMAGQFNYSKAGILDRTHTRLFTFRAISQLLRDAGFRIKTIKGVPAPFPKVLGEGLLGQTALAANLLLIRLSKTVFSYQIFVEAESTPDLDFLIRDAQARSARRDAGAAQ